MTENSTMFDSDLYYDRRVSEEFLALLEPGGVLHSLVEVRNAQPRVMDVQLRATPKSKTCMATLYLGLTSILDVRFNEKTERFRLRTHPTHRKRGGFDDAWAGSLTLEQLTSAWPSVRQYLKRVEETVDERHVRSEGEVHATMCSAASPDYRVIDREANVGFRNKEVQQSICADIETPIRAALETADNDEKWWPGRGAPLKPFGTGLDVLAVDGGGRLLVIEAKPSTATAGIAKSPAQVRFYADLFARWNVYETDPIAILTGMLRQRIALGLTPAGDVTWSDPLQIVPVVAIGAGKISPKAIGRLQQVEEVVRAALPLTSDVMPLEVWRLDEDGLVRERL